jgi:hypothetical protein
MKCKIFISNWDGTLRGIPDTLENAINSFIKDKTVLFVTQSSGSSCITISIFYQ